MNNLHERQKLAAETDRELDEVIKDMRDNGWRVIRRWIDSYSCVAIFEK